MQPLWVWGTTIQLLSSDSSHPWALDVRCTTLSASSPIFMVILWFISRTSSFSTRSRTKLLNECQRLLFEAQANEIFKWISGRLHITIVVWVGSFVVLSSQMRERTLFSEQISCDLDWNHQNWQKYLTFFAISSTDLTNFTVNLLILRFYFYRSSENQQYTWSAAICHVILICRIYLIFRISIL